MRKAARFVVIALAAILGLILVAIAPFLILAPRAPRAPARVESVDTLETYLRALTAHETPPAVDVVVMKNGALVYSKAFGFADRPGGKAARPDDVYHYWSVTKLFTATAVMQLWEDGKLDLDDTVAKYLPTFRTVGKSGAPADITIRQLLNHTSGMKNLAPTHLIGWIHHLDDPPVDQAAIVRDRMQPYLHLAAAPGSTGAYSNAGYIVLGALVGEVTGQTYEDFVRSRILLPLGMTSTDFIYRDDMRARAVTGTHPLFHFFTPLLLGLHHDWFSRWVSAVRKSRMWIAPVYADYTGPTGLLGTAEDLARFGQAFISAGQLGGRSILKAETAAKMLDEGYGGNTGPDKDRMGIGWHWWNDAPVPFKGHGGDGPGFSAQLAVFPERKMVVVVLASDTLIDRVGLTKLIAGVFK